MPANLSTSVDIAATPEKVWEIVSDLKRMAEWSPSTAKVIVRGGEIKQGATMVNINRMGLKVWPTQSKVIAYEPERRIAFKIRENHSTWIYELEPTADGGTRLTETRDVSNDTTKLSKVLIDKVLGGEPTFEAHLMTGMKQTLAKIKSEAETA